LSRTKSNEKIIERDFIRDENQVEELSKRDFQNRIIFNAPDHFVSRLLVFSSPHLPVPPVAAEHRTDATERFRTVNSIFI